MLKTGYKKNKGVHNKHFKKDNAFQKIEVKKPFPPLLCCKAPGSLLMYRSLLEKHLKSAHTVKDKSL